MKNLFSEKGVSIIQALLISGLLAGLALIGTSLLKDQKNAQKGAQVSDEISALHQLVTNILQDKKHCTATIIENESDLTAGNWKGSGGATPISSISMAGLGGVKPVIALNGAGYINGKVSVSGIRLNYSASQFEIDYRRIGEGTTAKTITKFVKNIVFKNEGGIDTCYTNLESANNKVGEQFCTSMGEMFLWNGNDCSLREQTCAADEVFIGIDSLGNALCRKTADYADWQNILDTSTSCNPSAPNTTVNLETVGGKIRIKCTSTGPCTTPPLCISSAFYCASETPSTGINGCGQACPTGTKPPTDGTWNYSAWGTCDPSTLKQTRTASCTPGDCGGACTGTPVTEQDCVACENITRCAVWEHKFFKDYCGKTWMQGSYTAEKGYSFNGYYRPETMTIAPDGYYDSGYNCKSTVVECVPPEEKWQWWTTMSYSWPLKSRCVQNGNCVSSCSCPATGCASTEVSGW